MRCNCILAFISRTQLYSTCFRCLPCPSSGVPLLHRQPLVWHTVTHSYKNMCKKGVTPDDGHGECPKHVELSSWNKSQDTVASGWICLYILKYKARNHEPKIWNRSCREWNSHFVPSTSLHQFCSLQGNWRRETLAVYFWAYMLCATNIMQLKCDESKTSKTASTIFPIICNLLVYFRMCYFGTFYTLQSLMPDMYLVSKGTNVSVRFEGKRIIMLWLFGTCDLAEWKQNGHPVLHMDTHICSYCIYIYTHTHTHTHTHSYTYTLVFKLYI
jgi:hypothetical protein